MTEEQARQLFLDRCQVGNRGALERHGERPAIAAILAAAEQSASSPVEGTRVRPTDDPMWWLKRTGMTPSECLAALTTRSVAVSSEAVDQIATMIFDNPKIPGEFNLSDARELARSILEAHPAHEAGEVERLRAALTFYADRSVYIGNPTPHYTPVLVDAGDVARAALEDKAQGAQQ